MNTENEPRALVAGNWKMNRLSHNVAEARALTEGLDEAGCDCMLCPPAPLLPLFATALEGSPVALGGQDCHPEASGAHTGDISAEMLADVGCEAVIVGHSERRADHGESDEVVYAKAQAAHRAALTAIICIGETQDQRDAGETLAVITRQLDGSVPEGVGGDDTVIAYEPVWAIGTGRTPMPYEIAEVHGVIRGWLVERLGEEGESIRILYGGSVKPSNARELMAIKHVNGALVGGASLKAQDFLGIIAAYK